MMYMDYYLTPPSSPRRTADSNLKSFLESVTPYVPSKPLAKSCLQELRIPPNAADKFPTEYFTMKDMWGCYEEWGVYGAGAPVLLNDGDTVIQYFVPYLSAIQIYTINPPATVRSLRSVIRTSSNASDSDQLSRSSSNDSNKAWDATSGDSSMGGSPVKKPIGHLYFQYYETSSPIWRTPLLEKVSEFAQSFPGLLKLKSVELAPASWMSIAWYPIYHIPLKGTIKDLATCFLTFHTLSSSFDDDNVEDSTGKGKACCEETEEQSGGSCKKKIPGKISLPPFGLGTHRMLGDVWLPKGSGDTVKLVDLHSAADSWLKQLNISHHDFNFFTAHANPAFVVGQ